MLNLFIKNVRDAELITWLLNKEIYNLTQNIDLKRIVLLPLVLSLVINYQN